MSGDLRGLLAGRIDPRERGLEFGPSFNPIAPKAAGFDVTTVDHLSREDLVAKYRGHGVDVGRIEEVDVVWDGAGPLAGIQAGAFDYVIASHVLEHVPDPVRFLALCEGLLAPGGRLHLLIPDKRYCFDHYRPISTTGQVLQAHAEGRTRPSGGQVFDHFAYASALGGALGWDAGAPGTPVPLHDLAGAYAEARATWETGVHRDVHCWTFTPASFRLVVGDLLELGLLGLWVSELVASRGEFLVTLVRAAADRGPRGRLGQLVDAAAAPGRPAAAVGYGLRRAARSLGRWLLRLPGGAALLGLARRASRGAAPRQG